MVFIYTTFPNQEEAEKAANLLLEKRVVGCVNFWPISSMYHWEGKLVKEGEILMIAKTIEEKVGEVENLIRKNHSYKVPCIATISLARLNVEYKEWLIKEIK
jgi:periplasmic divalent cation tolerance protein